MKFFVATVVAAAAGAAAWNSNVTYTTETVTAYTTYCPEATHITHGNKTYTVTAPTTLTITDCPCTITRPVITTSSVICDNCPPPTSAPTSAPVSTASKNATVPVGPTSTHVPTAGAAQALPALAGVVGLVAALL